MRKISLGTDVFDKLRKRKLDTSALDITWKDLCNATHATKYSQQVLRINRSETEKEFREELLEQGFFMHMDYSFDLLVVLLAMNYHLLVEHMAKRVSDPNSPVDDYEYLTMDEQAALKKTCEKAIGQYFKNLTNPRASGLWMNNAIQYSQPWW